MWLSQHLPAHVPKALQQQSVLEDKATPIEHDAQKLGEEPRTLYRDCELERESCLSFPKLGSGTALYAVFAAFTGPLHVEES